MTQLEQELQNELTRCKLAETSFRDTIANLIRQNEQLKITRNNQYLKIDELNKKIAGYEEDRLPLDRLPLITDGYERKGISIDAIDYINKSENSSEIIDYLTKETA